MSLLVLGAGFVGEELLRRHPEAVGTRRSQTPGRLRFDLADETTWANLPPATQVVWTFPATPADRALRLRAERLSGAQLVVLASTSAYRVTGPGAWVDERCPVDEDQPRVAGEEALRRTGATVLHLAGLWGGARDPGRWLVEGRIRSGRKHANLAHLDDVVTAIEAVLASPRPGERLNVCDGEPRRWSEHVERLVAAGRLPPGFTLPDDDAGPDDKRVSNERLRALLPPDSCFRRFT